MPQRVIGSLRGRLLLWYTAMLACVIAVFGALVCYLAWRTQLADIDGALRGRAETLARGLQPAAAGTFDLTLPPDASAGTDDGTYHVLWTPAGSLIDRSDADLDVPRLDGLGFMTRAEGRELTIQAFGAYILVGKRLDDVRGEIAELAVRMAGVGGAALAMSLLGGLFLVRRALRPLDLINQTARAMIGGDFRSRIPIENIETELAQVAGALNDAFDRLHAALERQRRFTADASHELRTPLATLATEVHWALGRSRQLDEYRQSLAVCERASLRMRNVVERLLALARAEALPHEEAFLPVDLAEIVESVVRDLSRLSEARRLDVQVDASPVVCHANRERLVDAVTNVLANAIEYNVDGGRILVVVRETSEHAEIVVTDTGVGISDDHLPRVFEPFFRADAARARASGGSGLGLAVTRATIQRHGGNVRCTSEPGRGTTVVITLPRVSGGQAPRVTPSALSHSRVDQFAISASAESIALVTDVRVNPTRSL